MATHAPHGEMLEPSPDRSLPPRGGAKGLAARLISRLGRPPVSFTIRLPDGALVTLGTGEPAFRVDVRRPAGLRALRSAHQLRIADAYIRGDIDIEGDILAAMTLKESFSDRTPWLKTWRRLAPILFGREHYNPAWIQKHYDARNIQLMATDQDYDTYTPGIYASDDDTLEAGAERKLAAAYDALGLSDGDHALDVGCGWGGFMRYAGRRGVSVTGITLSHDQFGHDQEVIRREALPAEVLYQDFFTYEPGRRFDAVNMMGVIEDLSDYERVVQKLLPWLRPGGRVYLDFAAAPERFGTGSFVTKYVWPGTFRMVYMSELIEVVERSPLEIIELHNDRWNYHLWAGKVHERWVARRDEIIGRAGEEIWRTFRLLYAGCASIMTRPFGDATAYRMLLELPAELAPIG
jgi:cyclopropane-fatty-acyl-phospholipid synthase